MSPDISTSGWYIVVKGRCPGVYGSWYVVFIWEANHYRQVSSRIEAHVQVAGVRGAGHLKAKTFIEARNLFIDKQREGEVAYKAFSTSLHVST